MAKFTETDGWSITPNWVIRGERIATPYAKLAYIALLNRANKHGECYPSMATIAKDLRCSVRTAHSAVDELLESGLIERSHRFKEDGSQASSMYRVRVFEPSEGVQEMQGGPASGADLGVQEMQGAYAGGADEVLPNEVLPNEVLPNKSEVAIATRPEVSYLLDLLDDLIVKNGSKRPNRNKSNIDAARLLLDKDGRTVEEAEMVIRWSQQDHFWRGNILSMAKLREKFDQMRLRAVPKQRPAEVGLDLVHEYQSLEQQELKEISC